MNRTLAIVIPLAGVGIGMVVLYGQLQSTRQQLAQSRQEVSQLSGERDVLLQQTNDQRAEIHNLEERVASLRTQLSSATTELEQSRTSHKELTDRYERASQEREQLQHELSTVTRERDESRQQVSELEQDRIDLERAVNRLRERLAFLDRDYHKLAEKLASAQAAPSGGLSVASASGPSVGAMPSSAGATPSSIPGAVELPPIVVRQDRAMMLMPISGKLLEVNEPHNFIIVDKGSDDGVRVGMMLDVLRGTGTVGRATVVRVRPHLSACDIVRAKTPGPLQVGDLAVQSGS